MDTWTFLREMIEKLPPEIRVIAVLGLGYSAFRYLRHEWTEKHNALAADLRPKIHDALTRVDLAREDVRTLGARVANLEFQANDLKKDLTDIGGRLERRGEEALRKLDKLDKKMAVSINRLNRLEYPGKPVPDHTNSDEHE